MADPNCAGSPYGYSTGCLSTFTKFELPDVVAGIAVRVFDQILLMIVFGAEKCLEGRDFSDDGRLPFSRCSDGPDHGFGDMLLLIIGQKWPEI